MKINPAKILGLSIMAIALFTINLDRKSDSVFQSADARVGRPLTPVSYAGVARRTTRRTVYAVSTVAYHAPTTVVVNSAPSYETQQAAAQAEQSAAQAQQSAAEANYAAQQAQASATAAQPSAGYSLPVGSTLPALPSGCDSQTVNDQSYFICGANWFRPAMQAGNIVYAVVDAPA